MNAAAAMAISARAVREGDITRVIAMGWLRTRLILTMHVLCIPSAYLDDYISYSSGLAPSNGHKACEYLFDGHARASRRLTIIDSSPSHPIPCILSLLLARTFVHPCPSEYNARLMA